MRASADPLYQDKEGGWTFLHWSAGMSMEHELTGRIQAERTEALLQVTSGVKLSMKSSREWLLTFSQLRCRACLSTRRSSGVPAIW